MCSHQLEPKDERGEVGGREFGAVMPGPPQQSTPAVSGGRSPLLMTIMGCIPVRRICRAWRRILR